MEIKEFLENYAEELRSEMDWKKVAPCYAETKMVSGRILVKDREEETIAIFFSKDTPLSFPVTRRDIQGATLLVNIINHLATH